MQQVILRVLQDRTQMKPAVDNLDQNIQRAPLVEKLLKTLVTLGSFLLQQSLEEPELAIRAGKSIRQWLESLESSLNRLEPLIAWDLDAAIAKGALRALLDGLEAYEIQRARGDKLPAPPGEIAEEDYGDWWAALVEYTAVQMWESQFQLQFPVLLRVSPEVHKKAREELGELLEKKEGP